MLAILVIQFTSHYVMWYFYFDEREEGRATAQTDTLIAKKERTAGKK